MFHFLDISVITTLRSTPFLLALLFSLALQQTFSRKQASLSPDADGPDKRAKWKLDCIVIDPGHGGKDPGTIGINGTKKKMSSSVSDSSSES